MASDIKCYERTTSGGFVANFGTYILGSGLYAILDYTQRPMALYKYKIQPGTNNPPDWAKMTKVQHL